MPEFSFAFWELVGGWVGQVKVIAKRLSLRLWLCVYESVFIA